ncbi:hypothetical protein Q8A64_17760 [Oxalobacteraceae bacterium R-40]|uniref:Uncharacterized protein n=1 Tax=Keguizhuia sedimenti TaxID=3064264 RepID=A0ABU1BTB2_9BURK|nr:hypothetical protein [Oxalobacteraceae bacterium R-40]
MQEQGKIVWGEDLYAIAALSPYGYCASHAGKVLETYSDSQKHNARAVIRELMQEYETVVFSCEAWGRAPNAFSENCLFADEFNVRVVAYVRPQVEWMNSAWWQWGAWTDLPLIRWIQKNRSKAKWHQILQAWRRKSWVGNIDIRILEDDIVQDFVSHLGDYSISIQPYANQGLPDIALRLFQRNRALRQSAHASAIEFILSRNIAFGQNYEPTPWVLRPKLIAQLLDYYRSDNEALLDCLPEVQKIKIKGNAFWWDTGPYMEKPFHKAADKKIPLEELEQLTVDALQTISRLDARLREFQAGWMKLKGKIDFTKDDLESSGSLIRRVN